MFSWTVRLKEDESFVYGAKTIIKPDFTSNNGTEPNWFYLKNIDVWFSKKKDLYNQSWDFPNYQRKEICLPHYDSKKTSQEENWMEDIEEIQTQKLSVSLFQMIVFGTHISFFKVKILQDGCELTNLI